MSTWFGACYVNGLWLCPGLLLLRRGVSPRLMAAVAYFCTVTLRAVIDRARGATMAVGVRASCFDHCQLSQSNGAMLSRPPLGCAMRGRKGVASVTKVCAIIASMSARWFV